MRSLTIWALVLALNSLAPAVAADPVAPPSNFPGLVALIAPPSDALGCTCPDAPCTCKAGTCTCAGCAFKASAETKPGYAVRVDDPSGGGSGTVVWAGRGKSVIVTNRHVAPADGTYWVTLNDKRKLPATFLAAAGTVNQGPDLAALVVDEVLPVCTLADADPDVGTEVVFWGRSTQFSRGKVTGGTAFVSAPAIDGNWPSTSGDSGSGLFDLRGRLVGVHWGGGGSDPFVRGRKFAARLSDLRAFLYGLRTRVPELASVVPVAARELPPTPAPAAVGAADDCPNGRCPNVTPAYPSAPRYWYTPVPTRGTAVRVRR